MESLRFIRASIALASLAGCAPAVDDSEPAEDPAEDDARARATGSPLVRPDFVFRFDPAMPAWLDRVASDSSSYALTQELPTGVVSITGSVRYDASTRIAVFIPDTDLDSRYPYAGDTEDDLAPWVEGTPEDTVQAPCMSTDAVIDGVPVSDGIPSCREQPGTWYQGQPLAYWGADPSQVDVFIELDRYGSGPDEPGATPQWGALERVRQAFLAHGYHVHFDAGSLYGGAYGDQALFNLGGGEEVPPPANPGNDVEMITLDPTAPCPPGGVPVSSAFDFISSYRRQHFDQGRGFSFYYFVFLPEVNGSQAAAQVDGANGAFAFGHQGWKTVFDSQLGNTQIADHLLDPAKPLLDPNCTHPYCNQIINYQAGTIMHEFGHNLGLLHHTGGPGTVSEHTPNYWSVMSYQYQTFGLPPDRATYDGDRFFFATQTKCDDPDPHPTTKADLERGPLSSWRLSDQDHFIIDYSDGPAQGEDPCIDEAMTDESLGVDDVEGPWIDWNCDMVDNGGPADLNGDGDATDVLCNNDDWGTIQLYHGYWAAQGGGWPNDGFPYACPLSTD